MGRNTPGFATPSALTNLPQDIRIVVDNIEQTYALYAGPIAKHVTPGVYHRWSSNYQPRLATLLRYVNRLADTLPEAESAKRFTADASTAILARESR